MMHEPARRHSTFRMHAATCAAVVLTAVCGVVTALPAVASQAPQTHAAHTATKKASWPKAARIFVGVSNLLYAVNPAQHSHKLVGTLNGNITNIVASHTGQQLAIVTVPTFGVQNIWVRTTADGATDTLVYQTGTKTGWIHDIWLRKNLVYFEAESLTHAGKYYIYSVHLDGTGFAERRKGSTKPLPDTMSPNARRLAHPSPQRYGQPSVLALARRSNSKLPVGAVGGLDWSSNGRWIAYNQAGKKAGGLGIVHPNGLGERVIVLGSAASFPRPSYGVPRWSYDGKHLLSIASSTKHAPHLIAVSPLAKHPTPTKVPGLPRGFRSSLGPVAWARTSPALTE